MPDVGTNPHREKQALRIRSDRSHHRPLATGAAPCVANVNGLEDVVRRLWAGFSLAVIVVLGGCGGGEMSLTEYVERINVIENRASQQGEVLVASAEQIGDDLTPKDLQAGLERGRAIRIEVKEATDGIEPPEQIADLHYLIFDWHTKFISIEETLATRAGTAADTAVDWKELSESPEIAAYRAAIAEGKMVCAEF